MIKHITRKQTFRLFLSLVSITGVLFISSFGKDKVSELEKEQAATVASMILTSTGGSDAVNILDLRGTICYPQLDKLVSCGAPDTLAILLFTKSEEPIQDVIINLDLDDGLQFGGFAEIGTPDGMGMSLLDSLNTSNASSPTFRLSELSQAGGAVVLQFGIQATCGHDFVANPPGINLNLDYAGCSEEFPLDPIDTEPLTPEIVFTGAAATTTISDLNTQFCMSQDITQITLDASTGEATLTISDWGFPDISLDDILVDGNPIPSSDIMIDANGVATVVLDGNANASYFGGDGILDQNEISTIDFCFSMEMCPAVGFISPFRPNMSIAGTCNGILCGGNIDFEEATLNIVPNFGTVVTTEHTTVQDAAICDPLTGAPAQYIFDLTVYSSRPEQIQGALYDLRFLIDECPGGALLPDSVQVFTGGSATGALVTLPLSGPLFNINDDGRLTLSLRGNLMDFDGPGGLTDFDGDGGFDDLEGSDTLRLRVYLGPLSCASGGACGQDDSGQMQVCQFTNVLTQYRRNCSLNTASSNSPIDPLSPELTSNSLSEFTNLGTIGTGNNAFPGYDFGVFGNTAGGPVSSTIEVNYQYVLDPGDFSQCPDPGGDISYEIFYLGDSLTAENMQISNIMVDGVPGSATTTNFGSSTLFEIPMGNGTEGIPIDISYELTLDTFDCLPNTDFVMNTRVVENCPTCDCSPIVRTCQVAVVRVNPDDFPNCQCDVTTFVSARRCNLGYTDRSKTTQLTMDDFPGDDHPQLDQILPGDTIEFAAQLVVTNPAPWNNRTERIGFSLRMFQAGSVLLSNLLGRLDVDAARLEVAEVKRGNTVFPMSDIQPMGGIEDTFLGIKLLGATGSTSTKNIHPALTPGTYMHTISGNSSNDYQDGAFFRIYFWGEDRVTPGQFNGIQALYDLVGGAFELNDTVCFSIKVPTKLTPETLANGAPTVGPLIIEKTVLRAIVDARDLTPSGSLSGNFIGGGAIFNGNNGATACIFQDTLCFRDPGIQLESIIDYSNDNCAAEIIHNFTVDEPIPSDWYDDPPEYRCLVGVEQLFSEFPEPYIYAGGASYELLDNTFGPTIYEPDSIASVDTIDGEYFCATNRYGELYFVDAETKDGLREDGYDCFDDDTDVSLTGGTFPLVGVGGDALADPDTLQFRIPIIRLCTDEAPETPVDASYLASYPYIPDYRIRTHLCNDARWYSGTSVAQCTPDPGTDAGFYWPWTRDSLENPHRFSGALSMLEIGTPVPSFELEATVDQEEIPDTGGGETNVFTICPVGGGTISEGIIMVEVPTNVTLDGGTPALTEIESTSTSTIYSADLTMGTPNGACFDFELETSLIFCGPDDICAYALPCDVDPLLVLAKDLDCIAKVCYRYRAGEPEIQAGFNFPVNPTPCAIDNFEINFNNTGSSYFTEVDPVFYLPVGMDPILPFTVELTDAMGGTTTAVVGGMLDPALSGANGNAYTIDAALLEALLGAEGFEPQEGLAFMFMAEIGCEFRSGTMPAALFRGEGDCEPYELFDRGQPINTVPPESGSEFDIQVDDLEINCTEGGADVQITTLNVGKTNAGMTRVCLQLPADVMLDPADIEVLAPVGFEIENLMSTPLGTSGDMEVSFDGPVSLDVGGFFCVGLSLLIDPDQECGILEVGFQVKSVVEVVCPSEPTGNCSMESIVASEILPFEVVPAASVGDATLSAACNADPTLTDLEFELTLESLGSPFNGNIDVELFFDLDNNGMVDPYDTSLGTTMATASIPSSGTGTVNGAITVPGETACSIVAKLSIPGCGCSMLEIPFPEIEPAFLAALGENVAVCPGEPFVIEDICGELEMEFMPPAAGTVVIDDMAGTATIMLNPGFGVDAAVMLMTNFSIGSCVDQEFITKVRSVGDFNFGPYEVLACNDLSTELDFMIPSELQDDIMVTITPGTFLDDPNSIEPTFINPTSSQSYLVEFSLNGQCTSTSTIDLIVTERSEVTVNSMFEMCDTILDLEGIVDIDPPVDADWLTGGDGTFDGGTDVNTAVSYIPGPGDIANGMVTLFVETMQGEPCGNALARVEVTIEPDTIPPSITCPNDICVPNDEDWCGATLNLPLFPVEDNCTDDANIIIEYNVDMAGWTDVSPNNEFFPNDTTEIGIRVTDEAGNMDSCFFNFIVKEKQPPEAVCTNIVIDFGESEVCDTFVTAEQLGMFSTDECELDTLLIGLDTMNLSDTFFITGILSPADTTIQLVIMAMDTSGNSDICFPEVRIICGEVPDPEAPDLGVAKREVGVWLQDDGCALVTYELNVENLGNVDLMSLQVEDDLAAAGFGACGSAEIKEITSDDFLVNPDYDGFGDTDLLSGTDILEVGDKGAILFTVEACGCPSGTEIMNTATGTATSPEGTMVEDESSDGSDPDPGDDGETDTDESDPTVTTLDIMPDMGLAKRVVTASLGADGCTEVIYEFNVENLGNVTISDIQVEDDLAAAGFAACGTVMTSLTSDEFTVNPAYDGTGDINMLLGTDNIVPGDVGSILLTVEACGCPDGTMIMNAATATGTDPAGGDVEDNSSDGSDPDPGMDGEGTDEESTTDFEITEDPLMGVAKREVGVWLQEDGCALLTYEINVENFGNVDLMNLQVEDDLAAAGLGACASADIKEITSDDFLVNPAYDGMGDINLLTGTDILEAGDKGAILFTIEACGCPSGTMIMNSATATADTPGGDTVEDDSVDGSDPDADGDDDPTNDDGTTDTELTIMPDMGIAKRVVTSNLSPDGCTEIVYEFNIENLGNVIIDDIQVEDDLIAAGFGACGSFTTSVTSDEFTVDPAYDGMGNNNLLLGTDNIVPGDVGAILLTVEACGCPNGTMIMNSATATGTDPAGGDVEDNSSDGSDPDPGDDGESDSDEEDTTDFEITESPDMGVAKREVGVWLQDDGCALVTYEVNVENLGDVNLQNLQVEDDLDAAGFGACASAEIKEISSDDFIVNGAYDGFGDTNLLTGTDELEVGDKGAILFTVEACGCPTGTVIMNSATATADTPGGDSIDDTSVDGSDPDPDGMGEDSTDEMSTTDTNLDVVPAIGLAKRVVTLVNNDDGSATVTFEFNVENYGNLDVQNVQVTDDLLAAFMPCTDIEVIAITSDDFTVNPAFSVGDINMLVGDDDLPVGDRGAILLTINVDGCGGDTGPFMNTATVTADSPDGQMLEDVSQDGSDPDPDGDGDPTNNNDPTEIGFEFESAIGIAKAATQVINNADGSSTVTFEFNVENFGNQILEMVQVIDNLGIAFAPCADIEVLSLTSDDFNVNFPGGYDGVTDLELLIPSVDLEPGDVGGILLTINVDDCMGVTGTFMNSAFVSAVDPSGMDVFDDFSQNGTDPDPDGDGDPTNNDVATPVDFGFDPGFGVSKRLSEGPILSTEGCYDITFEIKAENYGDVDLANVQIVEDLTAVFGPGDIWEVVSLESEEFDVNVDFDGIADMNLLTGLDTLVNVPGGNEGAVYLKLNVCPDGMTDPYMNSVTGSATAPDGTLLTDVSQDGSDPDPDGDGDPTNNNDPTVFQLECEVPMFTNCPRPPVIIDAPEGWCTAFANFSPPLAEAECGLDTILQVDMTGLNTGSLFPVGTTILKWVAIDMFGNVSDTCEIKIIVNDFHTPPTIACPEDVEAENDPNMCGAVVNDIAPPADGIEDNCPDNLAVVYTIEDEFGDVIFCGVEDASGTKFPVGSNTVNYTIYDQPILLITEIVQDGVMSGVEITNFGPASYDISCLVIGREGDTPEEYIVDDITTIPVGGVYTQLFTNIPAGTSAGYYIGFMNNFIDAVAINGYIPTGFAWSGSIFGDDILRSSVCDTDSADDWFMATDCDAASFGILNDGLDILADNGTTTSLQSEAPSSANCSFTVTVLDTEAPYCAEYDTTALMPAVSPLPIQSGGCNMSVVNIPTNFLVGDVNVVGLNGTYPDMGELNFTLVSPSGTEVILFNNICAGTADYDISLDDDAANALSAITCGPLGAGGEFQPIEPLKNFFGEESIGDWTLEIFTSGTDMGVLAGWELQVSELAPYSQTDTILTNDPGECAAEFTWMHPRVGDNCCEGEIEVEYTVTGDTPLPISPLTGELNTETKSLPVIIQGTEETLIFGVGTTTVTYTITDAAGNVSTCSFDVTVEDNEPPVIGPLTCVDVTINLGPGECDTPYPYPPLDATDNCAIDSVQYTPPAGFDFPIGVTEVEVVVFDAAGNSDTCSFDVTVIEFVPTDNTLVCNGEVNVSLGPDCTATITADMILEGDNYGCYDDYCVTITDEAGNVVGTNEDGTNVLDLSHVGMSFTVSICEDCSDGVNCCWGIINIEEKLIPAVECPADITLMCNQTEDPSITGEPIVTSCEPNISIHYHDEVLSSGICDDPRAIINRTWKVEDEDGNVVECEQVITVLPFDFDQVAWPENFVLDDAYDCTDIEEDSTLVEPVNTGWPTIDGNPIIGDHYCEINVGYWDEYLIDANCPGAYEILRNWIVRDECMEIENDVNPLRHIQAIKVNDSQVPVFGDVIPDQVISTDYWSCSADFNLSAVLPTITDACGIAEIENIKVEGGSVTQLANGTYMLLNLEKGEHLVTITANDQCHNRASASFTITVRDLVAPNVVCVGNIVLSLSSTGLGTMFAESVDAGSYDACTDIQRRIFREDTPCGFPEDTEPGESIHFCCEDIGTPVMVGMAVWDDADMNGVFGTVGDNYSECWVEVTVEDKFTPQLGCPADVTITCDQDFTNLFITGAPAIGTVCNTADAEYEDDLSEFNECGNGVIYREWTIVGEAETCTQVITVVAFDPFTLDDITFPADYEGDCLSSIPDDEPIFTNSTCSMVGVHVESDTFYFDSDACYKVLNQWTVIDWCQYDSDDPNSGGIWTDVQEIKITDSEGPQIGSCQTIEQGGLNSDCILAELVVSNSATDNNCGFGPELTWFYQIDIGKNGTVDLSGEIEGSNPEITVTNVSVGYVEVQWVVTDGCGNSSTCTQDYHIFDGTPPVSYCQEISTSLGSNGEVEIWASDFNLGAEDNCDDQSQLSFSFTEDGNTPNMTFDCDDIPNGIAASIELDVWVFDSHGNGAFCTTTMVLGDNNDVCTDDTNAMATIEGRVETEDALGVNNVQVTVENMGIGEIYTADTDESGEYDYNAQMPVSFDYSVTPTRNDNPLNGVTTLDVLLMQRHILGLDIIDSPYKIIAGDINNSESLTGIDIVELRKLILGHYAEFPDNTSWRFVNKDFVFTNAENPWPFEEVSMIEPLVMNENAQDFIGVKVGDVNGSNDPSNLTGEELSDVRGKDALTISIEDMNMQAGEEYVLDFYIHDDREIVAFQGALVLDPEKVEILSVDGTSMEMGETHFGPEHLQEEGILTFAWTDPYNKGLSTDTKVSVRVQAKGAYSVKESIAIAGENTPVVSYYADGTTLTEELIELDITEREVLTFEVHQNTPNPFINTTSIRVDMPEDGLVEMKIMDALGQKISTQTHELTYGENVIELNGKMFLSGGVYIYEIRYKDHPVEVFKMIYAR